MRYDRIKGLLKRSQLIVRLYIWLKFGKSMKKAKLIQTVRPYALMDYSTLSALYDRACHLNKTETSGSFVECGVSNGGSAAIIAATAKKDISRHIWLFDSWEGFPETEEIDIGSDGKQAEKGAALGSEETVRELLFNKLKLDSDRVHLVKGWFADTLSQTDIGPITLLHLDCDLYKSVKLCLEQLYDNIITGGYIYVDDYRYYQGCKKAVDDFINHRNLKIKLIEFGEYGKYFRKES